MLFLRKQEHQQRAHGVPPYSKRGIRAPAETRTPDTLIKSQVLYRLSYRGI